MKINFKLPIILLSMFLLFSCSQQQVQNRPTGSNLIGGSFEMETHNGKKVTEKSFYGKNTLVFFGFTSCPSVCPLGLSTMSKIMQDLPKDISKNIQPIFVTVDPEGDTHDVIKKYVTAFGENFIGLRGTEKNTLDMVKKYRGYYKKVYEGEDKEEYTMDHSDIIYLMDKKGRYLSHFSSATGVKNILAKINKAL